jgi:hypothetical protein
MAGNALVLPLRIAQAVLAIIVLGLIANSKWFFPSFPFLPSFFGARHQSLERERETDKTGS